MLDRRDAMGQQKFAAVRGAATSLVGVALRGRVGASRENDVVSQRRCILGHVAIDQHNLSGYQLVSTQVLVHFTQF